ncbi:TPA: hypothetical protein J8W34_000297 [Citrobacter koseri]|nr:hypothetical protein [Citrobacter koseri]HBA1378235.1 hypothetical protein [Citrobacter koseri]
MKVKLIGGPYDGRIIDVEESHGLPKQSSLYFPPPLSAPRKLTADDFSPGSSDIPVQEFLYALNRAYITDKAHNFEYHYQGR